MNSNTFQIADFSVAAAAERHQGWTLDMKALHRLERCCKAIDDIYDDWKYEVRISIPDDGDNAGDCCVELITADSVKPVCSMTVNGLFIPDKQS